MKEEKIVKEMEETTDDILQDLETAGLISVVDEVKKAREFQRKIDIAIKSFPLILTTNKITEFNEKLHKETLKEDKNSIQFKQLAFTSLKEYRKIPPKFVLEKIKNAKNMNCFDNFEVCTIEWIKEVKDPVVFGVINGTSDKFFITQWDTDITITELLEGKNNE